MPLYLVRAEDTNGENWDHFVTAASHYGAARALRDHLKSECGLDQDDLEPTFWVHAVPRVGDKAAVHKWFTPIIVHRSDIA